jgi:BlaI family transcriptional regulator, penicillinase repressor
VRNSPKDLENNHLTIEESALTRFWSSLYLGNQIWETKWIGLALEPVREEPPMARPAAKNLTDRELEVMHVFWKHRDATAAETRDYLAAAGLDRSYPTIANLVRILAEKGFLEQINAERPFRYRSVRSYEDVSGRLLGDLLQRVFRGSRAQLLVRLIDERKLTAKERSVLEAILKEQGE